MIVEKSFIKVTNADGTIAVADYFDSARVETSQTVETDHAITPMGLIDLPDEGTVEKGMYNYNGTVVFCHQKHERTIYEPIETPALFTIFRTNSDTLEWIQNEKVELGWKRMYNSVQYECIQAHMTVEGQTPDITPALWNVVATSSQWTAGVAYTIGDVVTYEGAEYECRQSHTAQVGWEPPNVLALWLPL
jgi:hypothetical protein